MGAPAVLSGRGMQDAFALDQSHGAKFKSLINNNTLKPFIDSDLATDLNHSIKFTRPGSYYCLIFILLP